MWGTFGDMWGTFGDIGQTHDELDEITAKKKEKKAHTQTARDFAVKKKWQQNSWSTKQYE